MNALPRVTASDLEWRRYPRNRAALRSAVTAPEPPDRVITLAPLSAGASHRLIFENLARTLRRETGRTVLLIHLGLFRQQMSLEEWGTLKQSVNGEFGLNGYVRSLGDGVRQLVVRISSGPLEAGHFLSLLDHCKRHFHYVLLVVRPELPMAFLFDCLNHSDRTLLFLQPYSRDFYHRDLFLREVRSKSHQEGTNIKTIVCRENGEEHGNDLLKQLGTSINGFIHGCPTAEQAERVPTWTNRTFQDGIRRLAREIGRRRVGLVLSSGGARGLSHIGVIQVLEENGIEVDVVAGCSMGSYVGAVWAFGYDGVFMEKLAREVEHRWGMFELLDPFILPRQGFLRGEKVKRRLKQSIGDVHFSELARPLRVVATNLFTLERMVFSSGEVAEAVHASSAVPGACAPVKINGESYIDGGICDPLPVGVMEEMGVERIIAINTIPTPAYLRCSKELEQEQAELKGNHPGPIRQFVNRHINFFAPGNILDTIFRSFHGAQIRVAEQSCAQADLVLRPLSLDGRWHDFRHPGKYIAIGRREAEEHIEEIKALVNQKDSAHENTHAEHAVGSAF